MSRRRWWWRVGGKSADCWRGERGVHRGVGCGGGNCGAHDAPRVVYLNDNEMAVIQAGGFKTMTIDDVPVTPEIKEAEFKLEQMDSLGSGNTSCSRRSWSSRSRLKIVCVGGSICMRGRVVLGGLANYAAADLVRARRVIITGCGTTWHAGLVGEYLMEDLAKIPTEVEYASEFRYRNPIIEDGTIVSRRIVSQSGETADTLAALREAKDRGALSMGIINTVGSTIARETDAGVCICMLGRRLGWRARRRSAGRWWWRRWWRLFGHRR